MLHVGDLGLGVLRVFHNFGVVASIDHHPDHPFSILKSRASQDKLVVVQVNQFCLEVFCSRADWTECAFEAV